MRRPAGKIDGGGRLQFAGWVQSNLALLPGFLVLAVLLDWTRRRGGLEPVTWYPGALILLGALAVVAPGLVVARLHLRLHWAAIGALAAFAAWCFASIAWSEDRGIAWEGANRTLLYLTIYALFALLPWQPRGAAVLLGLYAAGVATIGTAVLIQASESSRPATFFLASRLSEPLGYQNADCAAFMMAFWPAVFVASRRATPWVLRGPLLAAGGVLLELSLLSQSRGWLVALPVALLLFFAVVPGRLRSLIWLAAVTATVALARQPILDVYLAGKANHLHHSLLSARHAVLVSALTLTLVGWTLALLDRAWEPPVRLVRRASATLGAAAACGGLAVLVLVVAFGKPTARLAKGWNQFTSVDRGGYSGTSYLTRGLGSNRYDAWRVAAHEFKGKPLTGVGVDNFAIDYERERKSSEELLYPHSLEARVVAQTGIVGTGLFLTFLTVAAVLAVRRARRDANAVAVASAVFISFGYWFVHGSVDWFWEIPALGGAAFMCLGMAGSLGATPAAASSRPRLRLAAAAAAATFAVVGGTSFVLPWLSALYTDQAARTWKSDPRLAFSDLERARKLNRLDNNPDLIAGAIASRLGNYGRMRGAFANAVRRTPEDWYANLELGVAEALLGRKAEALRSIAAAQRLNPGEPTIPAVARRIRTGAAVSPAALDREFLDRVAALGR